MLHSYSFTNYQSFANQTNVSLELNKKAPQRGLESYALSGQRLSLIAAIMGANGAGKTAALKPLIFAYWFMAHSFSHIEPDELIPFTPHSGYGEEPTEIEFVTEDQEGTIWKYVLRLTKKRVLHEALYKKKERFTYVFVRDWDAKQQAYEIKQQGFDLSPSQAKKVRENASLISTAVQYEAKVAMAFVDMSTVVTNVHLVGRRNFLSRDIGIAARQYLQNEPRRLQMVKLLKSWDLGLSDIKFEEVPIPSGTPGEQARTRVFAKGIHRCKTGSPFEVAMEEESSGTQSAFVLLSHLLRVLSVGGLAVIDELENDLHPHMVEPIIDLFSNQDSNPHHSQLIFTCHTSEVLDLLPKSQIFFVEKINCESSLYRGDEIQGLRSDDNLRAKYMAGALGAVPRI